MRKRFLDVLAPVLAVAIIFAAVQLAKGADDEPAITPSVDLALTIRNAEHIESIQRDIMGRMASDFQQELNRRTGPQIQIIATQETIIADAKKEILKEALKAKKIDSVDKWMVDTEKMAVVRIPEPPKPSPVGATPKPPESSGKK